MAYAALGYLTGIIRRIIGILTVYGAFLSATYLNTGLSQQILNFQPFTAPADSRLYAYVGVMAIAILAVEGLAAGYNERLQLAVVVLNRFSGFVIGLLTGVLLAGFLVFVINGYANPTGGTLTDNQVKMRTAYSTSALAPVVLALVHPARGIFAPVLPRDPTTFFNTAHD